MAEVQEMSLFQKAYDLYRVLHEATKKYSKGDRYSIGEETKKKVLEVIEAITKAGHAKKEWKVSLIEQAVISLELVKVFTRLGYDTRSLNQQQYLEIQERIQEIGRMLGGWKRSL